MKILKRVFFTILLFVTVTTLLCACEQKTEKTFTSLEDFDNAKIGILTGSSQEAIVKERYPDAERVYFSGPTDLVIAVEQGKIDGYMFGSPFLPVLLWENSQVKRIEEAVDVGEVAFAFPKDTTNIKLKNELNEFLVKAKEDGTIDDLKAKWLGDTEPTEHPDYSTLTGENGTIRLAVVAENKPLIYQYKDQSTGLETELLTLFAKQYGYSFDIEVVPFDSVIMGMAAGKYDMAAASLQITAERSESVDFSEPYTEFEVVMVVRDDDAGGKGQSAVRAIKTLDDLKNASLAVVTGTIWDHTAQVEFPNAKLKYFSTATDMLLALEQGKVDAIFIDRPVYTNMRWENALVSMLEEPIGEISNALILAKDNYDKKLLDELNEFIAVSKTDGTLDMLSEKWFSDTEPTEHPDYTSLKGENGTLKVALENSMKPIAYRTNERFSGYEVELMTIFAERYGYRLEFEGMAFEALIPSVASGKCDVGASGITITEERKESVTFTDAHLISTGVAVVLSEEYLRSAASAKTIEDIENGSIAVMTGTVWDSVARTEFPDAEIKYFATTADTILALEQDKVDGILAPQTFYSVARWENVDAAMLDERVGYISSAFMLPKENYNAELLEQLNDFIERSKSNGTIDALKTKWLGETEPTEHPDPTALTGENGTLRVAVDNTAKPMTYLKNDSFTGCDIELLTMFAAEYGYALDITGMTFDALLPAVSAEKYDLGACGIAITEERAASVTFTDSYMQIDGVVIVNRTAEKPTNDGIFADIIESFEKTFIREDRWKLIVEGIFITLLISVCSVIGGSLLGFGLYLLSRTDNKMLRSAVSLLIKVYSRIVAGTPVVVILMILFYVVFGHLRDISGTLVAIIGFSLIFGSFVCGHMAVAVSSVDPGQAEAAYALGYSKNRAFFRIVLPQAMTIFLPTYCGQAVELIKATSVVGYIAVNDLTKMGDIIRSNTYEAFFPLITTAAIYFLLTWLVALLLNRLRHKLEPRHISETEK